MAKLVATIIFTLGAPLAWSQQFVGLPVIDNSALTATSSAVNVEVSALVTSTSSSAVLPNGVNLVEVNSAGNPTRVLATLNDNGVNGDAIAGDAIFGGVAPIQAALPGLVRVRISAAFRGRLLRVLSDISNVEIFPSGYLSGASNPKRMCRDSDSEPFIECNRLAIFFPPGTNVDFIRNVISQVQGTLVDLIPFPRVNVWIVETQCTTASCIRQQASILNSDTRALGAEINQGAEPVAVTTNDPELRLQYGIKKIEADKAWAITIGSFLPQRTTTSIIAVVNTGIDGNHEDLTNRVAADVNLLDEENNALLRGEHGTQVAGVISANTGNGKGIAGTSWDGRFVSIRTMNRFVDQFQEGSGVTITKGIRTAVTYKARIVNLSLRTESEEKVAVAMDFANRSGRLIVASAGNNNCNVGVYPGFWGDSTTFPHWYGDGVYNTRRITVGATDGNDARSVWTNNAKKCTKGHGSNYGPWVDIHAPGTAIKTTSRNNLYLLPDGTSFAAPFVSATANLVWATNPNLTAVQVKDLIVSTAEDVNTTNADGAAIAIKRLNAFHAVLKAAALKCNPAAQECPADPAASVEAKSIVMGASTNEADNQPASFHGVSIPLERPQTFGKGSWQVDFSYDLKTWDAYNPLNPARAGTGFWDVFAVSLSPLKYWKLDKIQSPLDDIRNFVNNPGFEVGFLRGGTLRADGARDDLVRDGSATIPCDRRPEGSCYLSIMLDTNRPPQTDNKYPSFGKITITDLTPK